MLGRGTNTAVRHVVNQRTPVRAQTRDWCDMCGQTRRHWHDDSAAKSTRVQNVLTGCWRAVLESAPAAQTTDFLRMALAPQVCNSAPGAQSPEVGVFFRSYFITDSQLFVLQLLQHPLLSTRWAQDSIFELWGGHSSYFSLLYGNTRLGGAPASP